MITPTVSRILGEANEEGYDGVVYATVGVRTTAKQDWSTPKEEKTPGAGKVIELSFKGNPSTLVLGITPDAARALINDLLAQGIVG